LPKSNAAPSLLAHIACPKYVDGLPLNRQEKQFHRFCADGSPLVKNLFHEMLLSAWRRPVRFFAVRARKDSFTRVMEWPTVLVIEDQHGFGDHAARANRSPAPTAYLTAMAI
jgi:hypothetical protein